MIVNTAVAFRTVGGVEVPGFLLMSSDVASDRERIRHLRLELLLDAAPSGDIFLSVSLPDKKEFLARSQPFPAEVVARLDECLRRAPGVYHLGLCPQNDTGDVTEVPTFGDDPLDPSGEAARAYAFLGKERWGEAAGLLEALLARAPHLRGIRTLLGRCLSAQGRDYDAERIYEEELRFAPSSALALNNLGTLYKRRGWMEHAFDCFSRALRVYPNHYEGLINFSTVLFYFGDLGGVRLALARAHRIHPEGHLVAASLTALADKLGLAGEELRTAVHDLAATLDLGSPLEVAERAERKDLKREETFRCFVDEAFRDGKLETWEREILTAAAQLLRIPVDLQCRIVVEAQRRFWKDELAPERPLDRGALFRRLETLASRDGVVSASERELLDRVAALLKVPVADGTN